MAKFTAKSVIGILVQTNRAKNQIILEVEGDAYKYQVDADFSADFFDVANESAEGTDNIFVGEPVEVKLNTLHHVIRVFPRLTIAPKKSKNKTFSIIDILDDALDTEFEAGDDKPTAVPEPTPELSPDYITTQTSALDILASNNTETSENLKDIISENIDSSLVPYLVDEFSAILPASEILMTFQRLLNSEGVSETVVLKMSAMLIAVQRASALAQVTNTTDVLEINVLLDDAEKIVNAIVPELANFTVEKTKLTIADINNVSAAELSASTEPETAAKAVSSESILGIVDTPSISLPQSTVSTPISQSSASKTSTTSKPTLTPSLTPQKSSATSVETAKATPTPLSKRQSLISRL